MKVAVYSDLHIEFASFTPPALDADVVVLAGDIHTSTRGVQWASEAFDCPIVYVCGNHEFYGGHIDRTLKKMKEVAAPHVHVLENESWLFNQTRFLGATAWTDFSATGSQALAMRKAAERMNDFEVIRADSDYRRLRPADVADRNRVSRAWLVQELSKPFDGRTVVVTHHAPIIDAVDRPYDHLTAAFANHWPELVEKADLWVFGHTHQPVDVRIGNCRVLSNPRGYPNEDVGFDPTLEVEL
ncbi:metallophosphoesterase [Pseudomonas hunanensis]|uniref:metallophosphoesterase n=1 Tax=Pseudomonas hunanensis TaxID=1247546 RepID=UPI0030DC7652